MREVILEQPELLEQFCRRGQAIGRALLASARAAEESGYEPNLAVIIRTKNDNAGLRTWFRHITRQRQDYKGRIDVFVSDTESTDGTKEDARDFGAKVIDVSQKDFSYPAALNEAMAETPNYSEAAYITVGHAAPAVSNLLKAGASHFEDKAVSAVSAHSLPGANASFWEKLMIVDPKLTKAVEVARRAVSGTINGYTAMISQQAWLDRPFDESYAFGSEDLAWARDALQAGETIIYEPALTVYHSHGAGLLNFMRELKYWYQITKGPMAFDQQRFERMRPELFRSDRG